MDFTGPIALILAAVVAYFATLFVYVLPFPIRLVRAWGPFMAALFVTLALSINWAAVLNRRLSGDDLGLLLAMIALVAFYTVGGWLIGAATAKLTLFVMRRLRRVMTAKAK